MSVSKVVLSNKNYTAEAKVRNHYNSIDEPVALGGDDNGPTPGEYLLTALGGCVSITLRMYAERKGWDLGKITVNISQRTEQMNDVIQQVFVEDITFEKEPTQEQKERLKVIAGKCPVAKIIKGENKIESYIS